MHVRQVKSVSFGHEIVPLQCRFSAPIYACKPAKVVHFLDGSDANSKLHSIVVGVSRDFFYEFFKCSMIAHICTAANKHQIKIKTILVQFLCIYNQTNNLIN